MTRWRVAARAVVLSAVTAPPVAAGSPRIFTSTTRVHDCLPVDGETLAATGGGLVAIGADGAARARWTSLDGLPATSVTALARVDEDALWIGSEAGLARLAFDGGGLSVKRTVASKPVRAIASAAGKLYAATWGGGVIEVGARKARKLGSRQRPSAARDRASSLVVHGETLWVGTAGAGLYRLDRGRLVAAGFGLDRAWIWSLASFEGRLWIGTMDGLYSIQDGDAEKIADLDVRDLAVVDGVLIAAAFSDGLYEVRSAGLIRARSLPRDATLVHAVADSAGAACVATDDGVWVRTDASAPFLRANMGDGPPSNDISALAVDGDRLWVGTFDRGVAYLEGETWRALEDDAVDSRVNAMAIGEHGELWIATAAGLSIVSHGRPTRRLSSRDLPSRNVLALSTLAGGGMLAGTTRGAVAIRDGRATPLGRKQGLGLGNVWAVRQDVDGAIWLGTTRGLYRGHVDDPDGFVRFSVATGELSDDWVTSLEGDGRTMWAGTYKGGVVRFDWAERAALDAVTAEALGGGFINPGGLYRSGHRLYAATMDGLAEGDGATSVWKYCIAGPGRDTTAVISSAGRIWVATRRGLALLGDSGNVQ